MALKLLDKRLPRRSKTGIWASIVSAVMLIGSGIFWVAHPAATEGSFSLVPDSDTAIRFAKILAIIEAVADVLPSIFVLRPIAFSNQPLNSHRYATLHS
jgi:hypothetical protein